MSQHVKDLFSGMKLLNENDEEVEAMSRLEDKETQLAHLPLEGSSHYSIAN